MSPGATPAPARVLVVDDDPSASRVLERWLRADGHEVLVAHDGREGMKAIVAHGPIVVVSDWMMPHVDGIELCRSVKTGLGLDAPYFIMITARDELAERVEALTTGADDYIAKPCHPGELSSRVRSGIRVVRLERELREARRELQSLRGVPGTAALDRLGGLTQCQSCQRVQVDADVWQDLARVLADGGFARFDADTCPDCLADGELRRAA